MSWSNLFLYSHAILQTWNEKSIVFSSSICKVDRGKGTANSCCQYIMYIFLQFQLGVWFQHTTILILLYMPCYYLHPKQRITCSIIGSVVLYDGSVIEVKSFLRQQGKTQKHYFYLRRTDCWDISPGHIWQIFSYDCLWKINSGEFFPPLGKATQWIRKSMT